MSRDREREEWGLEGILKSQGDERRFESIQGNPVPLSRSTDFGTVYDRVVGDCPFRDTTLE